MILKRLGIGKKSEYFLEAPPLSHDESKVNAKKKVDPQPQPAQSPSAQSGSTAAITPADVKAAEIAESPSAAPAAPAASKKKVKQTKPDEPKAAPKAVVATAEPATANFATEYLIPKDTPRRRPGPSLDVFKDMAKQVNSRK